MESLLIDDAVQVVLPDDASEILLDGRPVIEFGDGSTFVWNVIDIDAGHRPELLEAIAVGTVLAPLRDRGGFHMHRYGQRSIGPTVGVGYACSIQPIGHGPTSFVGAIMSVNSRYRYVSLQLITHRSIASAMRGFERLVQGITFPA
jgi:hypothetical protein